jgi:hypothetical protein
VHNQLFCATMLTWPHDVDPRACESGREDL